MWYRVRGHVNTSSTVSSMPQDSPEWAWRRWHQMVREWNITPFDAFLELQQGDDTWRRV